MLLVNHYADLLGARETFRRKQRNIDRLKPLFDFLERNYSKPIRINDAARICAMSSSHLMYFFRYVTGQSFLCYLNHFRVAKAQELLVRTELTILEIGLQVGFCDQSHFGSVFRKIVGVTPSAHRRERQREGTDPVLIDLPFNVAARWPLNSLRSSTVSRK